MRNLDDFTSRNGILALPVQGASVVSVSVMGGSATLVELRPGGRVIVLAASGRLKKKALQAWFDAKDTFKGDLPGLEALP